MSNNKAENIQRLQAALTDALQPLISDAVVAISFAAVIVHPDGTSGALRGNLSTGPAAYALSVKMLMSIADGSAPPPDFSEASFFTQPPKN